MSTPQEQTQVHRAMSTSGAPCGDKSVVARRMISVDASALGHVLEALVGPGHYIRELQMTRGLPQLGDTPPNPIDVLIEQYLASLTQGAAS